MRLPNNYGSVYKLRGKRRNPWCARKTVGWKVNPETRSAIPEYKYIGYYRTKEEALQGLADYNNDPYDLHIKTITLKEVYERWSAEHFQKILDSNIKATTASWKLLQSIWDCPFIENKVVPFFEYWIKKDCGTLICTPEEKPFQYRNYYNSYWMPLVDALNMVHRPHDTRHTCISLMTANGIDDRIIKKIVGHKG